MLLWAFFLIAFLPTETMGMSFWNSALASVISALPPLRSHCHAIPCRHSLQLLQKGVRNLCDGMLSLKKHAPFLAVCFHGNRSSSQKAPVNFQGWVVKTLSSCPSTADKCREPVAPRSPISAWLQWADSLSHSVPVWMQHRASTATLTRKAFLPAPPIGSFLWKLIGTANC